MTWTARAVTERRQRDRHQAPEQDHRAQQRVRRAMYSIPSRMSATIPGGRPIDRRPQVAPDCRQRDARQRERDRVDGQRRARARWPRTGSRRWPAPRCSRASRSPRRSEFARATCERPTRAGTEAVYPARNSERSTLIGAATSRTTTMVGPFSSTDSGISAVSAARPRSASNIIRRRSAPVGHGARDHPEDQVRDRLERPDDAHRRARTGQREHQQRQRRERDRVAEGGHGLGGQQDLEIAVPRERQWGDRSARRRWARTPRDGTCHGRPTPALRCGRGARRRRSGDRRGRSSSWRSRPDLRRRGQPLRPPRRRAHRDHPVGSAQGRARARRPRARPLVGQPERARRPQGSGRPPTWRSTSRSMPRDRTSARWRMRTCRRRWR